MKKVLVTGSQGYIGSVMMPMLARAGFEATGLDVGFYADGALVPAPADPPVVNLDLRSVKASDLEGVYGIVHLAALSNDPLGNLDPKLTFAINHEGTLTLARAAREAGVQRFVYASSCSIYGAAGDEALTEDAAMTPQTAYAESKVLAERDLAKLADERFAPTYMRNATAYGVSPRMRFDIVVNNLTGWAHTTGEVKLASDGSAWRPLVHIEDISAAAIAILEAPREHIANQAFNIGRTGENFRVRTIAETVQRAYPESRVTFGTSAGADSRTYNVSFAKAEQQLTGFQPRWTMEAGVAQCAAAYRSAGLTLETFEHRLYTRLKQLKYLMESGAVDAELRWMR